MKSITDKQRKAIDKLLELNVLENGEKISFTPTQKEIIYTIICKDKNKCGVITPTGYGKSTSVACGIIWDAIINSKKWLIVGGTESKAQIIMNYVIQHLFDNEIILTQLEISDSLDRLKRTRRKDSITFKTGGKIEIISADYKNQKRIGEILTGKHCQNVVIDDSVLCDDKLYAYIKNIVSGYKDYFLIELSNPLKRNHFYKLMTSRDSNVKKIWIDCYDAIKEGRLTEEFINERRQDPLFYVFYECKFPESELVDEKGYIKLVKDDIISNCFVEKIDTDLKSKNAVLGIDVGRGGDHSVICVRNQNKAKIIFSGKVKDLMAFVGIIIKAKQDYSVSADNIFVDDIGVGSGVTDRLHEQKINIVPVRWSEKSKDKKFANLKAESYWRLKEWLENGGKIEYNEKLNEQLQIVKYKINSSGQIVIQSKEELLLQGINSPDELEALVLSFTPKIKIELSDDDNITVRSDLLDEVKSELFDNNEFTFLR